MIDILKHIRPDVAYIPPDPVQEFLSDPKTHSHVLLGNFFHIVQSGVIRPLVFENVEVNYHGAIDDLRQSLEHTRRIGKFPTVLSVEPHAFEMGIPWTDLRGLTHDESKTAQQIMKVIRAESELPFRNIAINLTPKGFRNIV